MLMWPASGSAAAAVPVTDLPDVHSQPRNVSYCLALPIDDEDSNAFRRQTYTLWHAGLVAARRALLGAILHDYKITDKLPPSEPCQRRA